MQQTTILQIGDIHFPSAKTQICDIDDKDPGFPTSLKNIISNQKLKTIFKSIHQTFENEEIDAAVIMGDLTDHGRLKEYSACLNYITGSLQLGKGNLREAIVTGLIPGNHDINRTEAKNGAIGDKFKPLEKAVKKVGIQYFATSSVVTSIIKKDNTGAKLILLNSCWGCGEPEFIPEPFRNVIFKAVNELIDSGDRKYLNTYYDRQFDTPAISIDHITDTVKEAGSCDASILPIVCTHHNLLPQHTTRLAPYTELVNSGSLRASLIGLKRPVIFLHGHIHQDPIELISGVTGGTIISICAPYIVDGYNLLKIRHDRNGTPFICYIDQYRFDDGGIIKLKDTKKVSLLNNRFRSANENLNILYKIILQYRIIYWNELKKELENPETLSITHDELLEMIEILSADDSIKIINQQDPYQKWILQANK